MGLGGGPSALRSGVRSFFPVPACPYSPSLLLILLLTCLRLHDRLVSGCDRVRPKISSL